MDEAVIVNGPFYNHLDCAAPCFTCTGACTCDRKCSGLPLTIGDKRLISGRVVSSADEDGRWFCVDCLADLPFNQLRQLAHVCGVPVPAPEPLPAALVALLPEDPAHKTTTTVPGSLVEVAPAAGVRDNRQFARPGVSFARCSCGWAQGCDTRQAARWRARDHRREKAAGLAEWNGLAERLRDMAPERVAAMIAAGKLA
jgi:hypothetical protein